MSSVQQQGISFDCVVAVRYFLAFSLRSLQL
jgi:hypothetical protein